MKAIIDRDGRVPLTKELQDHLGVKPGDEVLLESRGNDLVIKPARLETGLGLEGNVLVHRGTSAEPGNLSLDQTRDERFEQLTQGLPG